jgi:hypothetical protein
MLEHKISGIPESPLGTQSGVPSNPTNSEEVITREPGQFTGRTIEELIDSVERVSLRSGVSA